MRSETGHIVSGRVSRNLAILLLILFALGARTATAQSGAFSGDVKDSATLAPLSHLRIYLLDENDRELASTITDDHGLFTIPHSRAGIFQLKFDRAGMKSIFGPIDTVTADSVITRTYTATFAPNPLNAALGESPVDEPVREPPGGQDAPRYPKSLKGYAINGEVRVSFVVDTTGHVDMGSVKLIQSSDAAFFKAVMDALPHMSFIPAKYRGHNVPDRVEQTFAFKPPVAR